jgi:hypothetical protein
VSCSGKFSTTLNNEDLVALRVAFDEACEEFGLSMSAEDTGRRERLAMLMLSLAKGGECDPNMIRIQSMHQMQAPN